MINIKYLFLILKKLIIKIKTNKIKVPMLFFNILVMLMCFMSAIVIGSLLTIIVIGSDNISRTRNNIVHNARIHLHIIRRNNAVGIEPSTAESTICSDVGGEEKRGPELV